MVNLDILGSIPNKNLSTSKKRICCIRNKNKRLRNSKKIRDYVDFVIINGENSADGFGITEKCKKYVQNLIKGEDYPNYKNGLPDYAKLSHPLVKKKLKKFK